jgi:hypothetical protein
LVSLPSFHAPPPQHSDAGRKNASRCTAGLDQLSFIFGLSSNAFAGFAGPGYPSFLLCGVGQRQVCAPAPVRNPFEGFEGVRQARPDLYSKPAALLADGGLVQNLPLWPVATGARAADVVFAVDSSAWLRVPPLSGDTAAPAMRGGEPVCPLDRPLRTCGRRTPAAGACCDGCYGPESLIFGCWPGYDPPNNALLKFAALAPPGAKLPPLPTTEEEAAPLIARVTIFGCSDVANKVRLHDVND